MPPVDPFELSLLIKNGCGETKKKHLDNMCPISYR